MAYCAYCGSHVAQVSFVPCASCGNPTNGAPPRRRLRRRRHERAGARDRDRRGGCWSSSPSSASWRRSPFRTCSPRCSARSRSGRWPTCATIATALEAYGTDHLQEEYPPGRRLRIAPPASAADVRESLPAVDGWGTGDPIHAAAGPRLRDRQRRQATRRSKHESLDRVHSRHDASISTATSSSRTASSCSIRKAFRAAEVSRCTARIAATSSPPRALACAHCGQGIPHFPPPPKVPNYLFHSIVVTLCCCLPLGIVALIFSAQVNTKLAAGDVAGARGVLAQGARPGSSWHSSPESSSTSELRLLMHVAVIGGDLELSELRYVEPRHGEHLRELRKPLSGAPSHSYTPPPPPPSSYTPPRPRAAARTALRRPAQPIPELPGPVDPGHALLLPAARRRGHRLRRAGELQARRGRHRRRAGRLGQGEDVLLDRASASACVVWSSGCSRGDWHSLQASVKPWRIASAIASSASSARGCSTPFRR